MNKDNISSSGAFYQGQLTTAIPKCNIVHIMEKGRIFEMPHDICFEYKSNKYFKKTTFPLFEDPRLNIYNKRHKT